MSDERRNDKRAIFLLRLASEDFDKKPSPHGLLDHFDGEDEFTESDAIRAALRELDRLTAERDAAHEKIVSFGSTMADLIMLRSENTRLEAETIESAAILEKAVKESKAIVAGYNRAIEERDAARAELANLRAACGGIADGIERTATHGVENGTKREWLRQKAKKIRAALESEADHE